MRRLLFASVITLIGLLNFSSKQIYTDETSGGRELPAGCTIVTISKGDSVLFGGNDDYINPDSYYWVEPGDSSKYGVIWIGTPDNPQQGVNEKGLAYDANGLPRFELSLHPERIPVKGEYYHHYVMQIMHECSSVGEVIRWANLHQHFPYMHDQLHFADATGDAVVISAGKDSEMVFTRKLKGDGFLVSSNFNVANTANAFNYPCWRYDKASELLRQLIAREGPITSGDARDVMDAVHVAKGSSWTIETMVADLVHGKVYIYYFFQYDRPVVLNVKYELSHPREPGALSKLFPEEVRQEAARRYHVARANLRTNWIVGITWPSIVLVSLILLFLKKSLFNKGLRFWITAVVILGPVGLMAGFFALKRCKTIFCRNTLIETLGSLIPVVISYTVGLAILVLRMLSGNVSWQTQLFCMFVLPIILGLVFHMAFLAPVSLKNAGRFLLQCLPLVIVTTFTGLGGIIPVALPLVNKSLNMSLLMPLSPLSVMTWWAIVVLGALPGGFLIFMFQHRAIKKEYRSWSVLTDDEGEILIPGWGDIWWWILISISILLAGLFVGVVLLK